MTELNKSNNYKVYYKMYATVVVLFILPWSLMIVLNSIVYTRPPDIVIVPVSFWSV